ncbi:MAG TPA: hypothetical protein VGC79_13300, partial [Polyangiaceae bacterium]
MPSFLDRAILPSFASSLLALAFIGLSACSKKPSSDAAPSATPAPPAVEAKAAEPKADAPLKIAFAYVGPVGDAG